MVPLQNGGILTGIEKGGEEPLLEELRKTAGVENVELKDNFFTIEAKQDIAPEVSRIIVNAGYSLRYLTKKEYGLDEIYHQYFQGGVNNHG